MVPKMNKLKKIISDEKGAVFVTGMMFLVFLTILGGTAYVISSNDVKISANYQVSEEAFNDADAGLHYGIAYLEADMEAGGTFPATFPGTPPTGFNFSLSNVTLEGTNKYTFTSTGGASRGAAAEIKVTIKRGASIGFGAFGDELLDSKSFAQYYSYDSRDLSNPGPSDSTGEADVGSNSTVSLKNDTLVDGDVALGNDGTTDASYTYTGTPNVSGEEGVYVGRVDPDPLGVDTQAYRDEFDVAEITNDNADITPALGGGTTIVNPSSTVTLPSQIGGSTYYLTEVNLFNSDVLNIDAANGDVTIYIRGTLITKNGSMFNVLNTSAGNEVTIKLTEDPTNPIPNNQKIVDLLHGSGMNENGPPTGFTIMTDSDAIMDFKNSSDVNGLVYAPNATVSMKNSNNVHGAVWANVIDGKNDSILYYDTALRDKFLSKDVVMTAWEEIRN
jgi:hypothetical protein